MAVVVEAVRVSGREFGPAEVQAIIALSQSGPGYTRGALARQVCEQFDWRRASGKLKLRECWELLLKLEQRGWIELPTRQRGGRRRGQRTRIQRTLFGEPRRTLKCALSDLLPLAFERVQGSNAHALWSELVDRYHYLGFATPWGAQLRYLVRSHTGEELACVQFSAPAWRLAARDRWIGWSEAVRRSHLARIVQQSRFLILPWVQVASLASHILAGAMRMLVGDWSRLYAERPLVCETLVAPRFAGSCYRAANWHYVGDTSGRGRHDREHARHGLAVKRVYVIELCRHARQRLCEPSAS